MIYLILVLFITKHVHQVLTFHELDNERSPNKADALATRRRRAVANIARRRDLDLMDDETTTSQQRLLIANHTDDNTNTEDAFVEVDVEEGDSNTQFSTGAVATTSGSRLTSFSNAIQSRTRTATTVATSINMPPSSNESSNESYSDWSEEDGRRTRHTIRRSRATTVVVAPTRQQPPPIVKTRSGRISTRRIVKRIENDYDMDDNTLDTTAGPHEESMMPIGLFLSIFYIQGVENFALKFK